ncbi:hypothetical protein Q3G72_015551 [Acer saccharum]|nr:hypothetical protein Q3G72_015551 [Acer saccharum]
MLFRSHPCLVATEEGKGPVTAVFKTGEGFTHAGSAIAQSGCWSMLKGGLTGNASGPAEIYFQSNNTSIEIWSITSHCNPLPKKSGDPIKMKALRRRKLWDVFLTYNDMNNLPTRDVVEKLLHEWGIRSLQVTTDANGFFETFLFHNAEYQIKIIHSAIGNSSSSVHNFKVPEASIADFDSSGQSTIMFLQVST